MTPEGKVKAATKKWLNNKGAFSFAPVSNGMGVHGIPDYIACVPVEITADMVGLQLGLFVGLEVKAPGRRGQANRGCSAPQLFRAAEICGAGGVFSVVDGDEDLQAVEAQIGKGAAVLGVDGVEPGNVK